MKYEHKHVQCNLSARVRRFVAIALVFVLVLGNISLAFSDTGSSPSESLEINLDSNDIVMHSEEAGEGESVGIVPFPFTGTLQVRTMINGVLMSAFDHPPLDFYANGTHPPVILPFRQGFTMTSWVLRGFTDDGWQYITREQVSDIISTADRDPSLTPPTTHYSAVVTRTPNFADARLYAMFLPIQVSTINLNNGIALLDFDSDDFEENAVITNLRNNTAPPPQLSPSPPFPAVYFIPYSFPAAPPLTLDLHPMPPSATLAFHFVDTGTNTTTSDIIPGGVTINNIAIAPNQGLQIGVYNAEVHLSESGFDLATHGSTGSGILPNSSSRFTVTFRVERPVTKVLITDPRDPVGSATLTVPDPTTTPEPELEIITGFTHDPSFNPSDLLSNVTIIVPRPCPFSRFSVPGQHDHNNNNDLYLDIPTGWTVVSRSIDENDDDALVLVLQPPQGNYTITFNLNGGTQTGSLSLTPSLPSGSPIGTSNVPVPIRPGYTFAGWLQTAPTPGGVRTRNQVGGVNVTGTMTFVAQWTPAGNQQPWPDSPSDPEQTPLPSPTPSPSPTPTPTPTPTPPPAPAPAPIIIDNTMVGFANNTIRPGAPLTRAQAITMFFRLLPYDARVQYWSTSNSFTDVHSNQWFNNAVSTMGNMGFVRGFPDGTFRPNDYISAAEMMALTARFKGLDLNNDGHNFFTDIETHWSAAYVNAIANLGLIDAGGPFNPNQPINRANTAQLFNRILGRDSIENALDFRYAVRTWFDLDDDTAWYYIEILLASNSFYVIQEDGRYVITGVADNKEWDRLEGPNARPYHLPPR
ncbi:MAG: S-layer homology domain-containing protein [Defluviitaleaceae bacterium]|nr:S-layer homology domain-containing protein [Defluviitaleaceae bacterium]